jgi:spermidine synthase
MPDDPVTLAREECAVGEVALRRRESGVLELVVDGSFAMDTVDVSTEVELARAALRLHPAPRRVLVGGLGLGFTARAVLADDRVEQLDVVEVAEPLVRWARSGQVTELAGLESEGRCHLHVADVADVLTPTGAPAGEWDVVLLDVDNGPDFLIRPANALLYRGDRLRAAMGRVAAGGLLVVWSSHRSPGLLATLGEVADELGGSAFERVVEVSREGRTFDYASYGLSRP